MVKMLKPSKKNNLNSEKQQFTQHKVDFYGHRLIDAGIQPSEDKLLAIKNLKEPENGKEHQTVIGMMTYLSRFSTRLAELSAPLRELIKFRTHFRWDDRHHIALEIINKEICDDPDPETKTLLQCDASQLGLGAWLRQIDKNGEE